MHRPLFALLALASISFAADWPQFRGPDSTGLAADASLPAKPKIDWTTPLPGRGLASPIVIGDKVFITASSGPQQQRLHVLCLNAGTGKKIWERQLQATGRTMTFAKSSVAACTPCSDGRRLFALWSSNDLAAFDLDGNLLWLRGLTADYPNASNSLGMASSPIVLGDTVVVLIENDSESYTLGIDARTGRNMWKLDRPKTANWTSPVPFRADAKTSPIVLLQSTAGILAVDPVSGSRLWEYSEGASTISSSVVADGTVFVPSNGITALTPADKGAAPAQLWRAKQINPSTISPLVLDGLLFSINSAGVIATADAKTGESKWKLRVTGPFSASPVGAGRRLALVNEKGLLQIVDVSKGDGFITGDLQLPLIADTKELILGTPALSGPHIFIRTDSNLWRIGEKAD
jgi:outer membrane protein assembly factor BamB